MFRSVFGLLVLLVAALPVLQGCALAPRDECPPVDWYAVGYQDGVQGRFPAGVTDDPPACNQSADYTRGHDEGVKQYCGPRNGFTLGLRGEDVSPVCPQVLRALFMAAYRDGKTIYDAETQVRRLDEILDVNEAELQRLAELLQRKEAELRRRGGSVNHRLVLLNELRELKDTLAMVEKEVDQIETALAQENGQLQLLREKQHW